jgi:predicted nucleic acid-binding protein
MENNRILIDTSIVIDYLRSYDRPKTPFVKLFSDNELYLSSISVFELFNGATSDAKKLDIEVVCKEVNILDFNLETAKIASEIYRYLRSQNKLIEFRDILISASALQFTLPIATLNQKHFERIEWIKMVEL